LYSNFKFQLKLIRSPRVTLQADNSPVTNKCCFGVHRNNYVPDTRLSITWEGSIRKMSVRSTMSWLHPQYKQSSRIRISESNNWTSKTRNV